MEINVGTCWKYVAILTNEMSPEHGIANRCTIIRTITHSKTLIYRQCIQKEGIEQ